jgi:hypothetical protein
MPIDKCCREDFMVEFPITFVEIFPGLNTIFIFVGVTQWSVT